MAEAVVSDRADTSTRVSALTREIETLTKEVEELKALGSEQHVALEAAAARHHDEQETLNERQRADTLRLTQLRDHTAAQFAMKRDGLKKLLAELKDDLKPLIGT